jgi:CcmD family protein
MNNALIALGIACLVVWAGLWGYLVALQKRVDKLEDGED